MDMEKNTEKYKRRKIKCPFLQFVLFCGLNAKWYYSWKQNKKISEATHIGTNTVNIHIESN